MQTPFSPNTQEIANSGADSASDKRKIELTRFSDLLKKTITQLETSNDYSIIRLPPQSYNKSATSYHITVPPDSDSVIKALKISWHHQKRDYCFVTIVKQNKEKSHFQVQLNYGYLERTDIFCDINQLMDAAFNLNYLEEHLTKKERERLKTKNSKEPLTFWNGQWEEEESVADYYDNTNDPIILNAFKHHIIGQFPKKLRLLDVGAGKGRLAKKILKLAKESNIEIEYLFLEPALSQCETAKLHLDHDKNSVTFIKHEFIDYSFHEPVDVIISSGGPLTSVVATFEEAEKHLQRMQEILAPGGLIIATGLKPLLFKQKQLSNMAPQLKTLQVIAETKDRFPSKHLQCYVLKKQNSLLNTNNAGPKSPSQRLIESSCKLDSVKENERPPKLKNLINIPQSMPQSTFSNQPYQQSIAMEAMTIQSLSSVVNDPQRVPNSIFFNEKKKPQKNAALETITLQPLLSVINDLKNFPDNLEPEYGLEIFTETMDEIYSGFDTYEQKLEKNVKAQRTVLDQARISLLHARDRLQEEPYSASPYTKFFLDIVRELLDAIKTCLHYLTCTWVNETTDWTNTIEQSKNEISKRFTLLDTAVQEFIAEKHIPANHGPVA